MKAKIVSVLISFLFIACTTTGPRLFPVAEKGKNRVANICIIADSNLSDKRILDLQNDAKEEFSEYGIDLRFTVEKWRRTSYEIEDVFYFTCGRNDLPESCDKKIFLIGQNWVDYIIKAISPYNILGIAHLDGPIAVVEAEWSDLTQVIFLNSPSVNFRHELRHLFGCDHGFDFTICEKTLKGIE